MTSLLQEIISVYTLLNPSQLTAAASNRVCNALALLQCVASHNETRALFLNATAAIELAPTVARIMAIELGYDESWVKGQLAAFYALAANYQVR